MNSSMTEAYQVTAAEPAPFPVQSEEELASYMLDVNEPYILQIYDRRVRPGLAAEIAQTIFRAGQDARELLAQYEETLRA